MRTRIFTYFLAASVSFVQPAAAETKMSASDEPFSLSSAIETLGRNIKETWSAPQNRDFYLPLYTWHNRLTYDQEKIDKYNENPWGFGYGVSRYDRDGDWHGLYAMAFKDSNDYMQTIFGYVYQKMWNLDDAENWHAGAGFTLSLTQRHEYYYIPVPLPLPVAGLTYKDFSLQAAYVPGVKNDGNVLFTWLRWEIDR